MPTSKPNCMIMWLLLVVAAIAWPGSSASAADTILVSYQGYLTDAYDEPITMWAPMEFSIYSHPSGISSTMWHESYDSIQVTNGFFNVMLGASTALPKSIFDGSDRWLGISVWYDFDILPRPLLGSVINAAVASQVHGDIQTAPGLLKILLPDPPPDPITPLGIEIYSPDSCATRDTCVPAIQMLAVQDSNIIWVYPPDPCVPPEPCVPALELIATAELHGLKIHPPEPCDMADCAPSIELSARPDGNLMRVSWNGGAVDMQPALELTTNPTTELAILAFGPPYDDGSPSIEMAIDAADQSSCMKMNPPSVHNKPGIEMCTDAGASTSSMRIGSSPSDENNPAVEIASTTNSSSLLVQGQDPAGGSSPPLITMTTSAAGAFVGIGTDSLVEALTVMGSGWFSGEVIQVTDTKVKRNVEPVHDALDKVARMNGYYYDCRTDEYPALNMPTERQIGFLAQEVRDIVPEATSENELGLTGVSYSRLTALLVEAVKELKTENEELRSRLKALEQR